MTRTIVSPVCTIGGYDRSEVRFVQQDQTTGEIFVPCYGNASPHSSVNAIAVFKANGGGALDRAAVIDADGSGQTVGWTGTDCPLGIAPGGQYILVGNPLNFGPAGITVLNRTTLAHVKHTSAFNTFITRSCISADEQWFWCTANLYHIPSGSLAAAPNVEGGVFDADNNLWLGAFNNLYKYTCSYSGGISFNLVATYNPIGFTNIRAISYSTVANQIILIGDDRSAWIFDIATATARVGLATFADGTLIDDDELSMFSGYSRYFYDTYITNSADGNFYISNPIAGLQEAVPMTTWGVGSPIFDQVGLYDRINGNIWSKHHFSSGDPADGIQILPYAATLPPEPPGPGFGVDALITVTRTLPIPKVRQLRPFEQVPFAEFHPLTSTAKFPVRFRVMEQADLRVTIDGVELDQADFTYTGTIQKFPGWDDADAIADDPDFIEKNNPYPGFKRGYITLDTAITDQTVRIWSEPAPARTTDLAAGDLKMAQANRDLETLWVFDRAQHLKLRRTPIITAGIETLPAASSGLRLSFQVTDGTVTITRAGSDTIYDGASTGSSLTATAIGALVELVSPDKGKWFIAAKNGDWALT